MGTPFGQLYVWRVCGMTNVSRGRTAYHYWVQLILHWNGPGLRAALGRPEKARRINREARREAIGTLESTGWGQKKRALYGAYFHPSD